MKYQKITRQKILLILALCLTHQYGNACPSGVSVTSITSSPSSLIINGVASGFAPVDCISIDSNINNSNGVAIDLTGGIFGLDVNHTVFGSSKAILSGISSEIGLTGMSDSGFLNMATISSDDWGIYNQGLITTLTNNGTIQTSSIGQNSLSAAIYNSGTITSIVNAGFILGDWMYGILNYTNSSIDSITNASGATIYGGYAAIENYDYNSTIGSISNSGTITSNGSTSYQAILNFGTITTINNLTGGVISGTNSASGIVNALSIDSLTNDGTISSAGAGGSAIYNYSYWTINDLLNPVPTIATLTNNGTVTSDDWGIYNQGLITTLTNNGTIQTSLIGQNSLSAAIYNAGTIGDVINTNIIRGDWMYGIVNFTGGSINSISNASGGTIYGSYAAIENYDYNSTIASISNSGTITSDGGSNGQAILSYGSITTLNNLNGGVISGTNSASGIVNALSIDSLLNDGTISSAGAGGSAIYNYSYWTINDLPNPVPTITTLTNNGTITSDGWGIYNQGLITALTNNGTIRGGADGGIFNSGHIGHLNNFSTIQSFGMAGRYALVNTGSIGSIYNSGYFSGLNNGILNSGTITSIVNDTNGSIGAGGVGISNDFSARIDMITNLGLINNAFGGAKITNNGTITTLNNLNGSLDLDYAGVLPTNYNVVIYSATEYGSLSALSITGLTNFGIYSGGVNGVPASIVTRGIYRSVLTGLTESNVGSTRSGTYNGLNWTLSLQDGSSSVWDLSFTGVAISDTQSSIHGLALKLRGAFSGQVVATNYANMNTYDCEMFDSRDLCLSVGGQQTYVDNPSSNLTSTVVIAGYKVSPQIRIGSFLNQSINNHTHSSVDISNRSPLMGLFAVWNQNEDRLGYQVKIANAYQDKDVTTTREIIGSSEAGTGKTELNTQSYVGELSYAFLINDDKTLVRPYGALRYTRIKQDGYTEEATAAVTAPLIYTSLSDRSTVGLMGVKLDHRLAENLHAKASVGIEQDINHHVDSLTATGVSGLTSENFNDNIKRTRTVASIGAYFVPAQNQRITGDIYYQQLPFQSAGSTTAYVNYMIGF